MSVARVGSGRLVSRHGDVVAKSIGPKVLVNAPEGSVAAQIISSRAKINAGGDVTTTGRSFGPRDVL